MKKLVQKKTTATITHIVRNDKELDIFTEIENYKPDFT